MRPRGERRRRWRAAGQVAVRVVAPDGDGRWSRRVEAKAGGEGRGDAADAAARRRRLRAAAGRSRRGGGVPTGRGGGQEREWYRGIPVPPGAASNFTRRNNTNYMQTGVLSRAAAHVDVPEPRRRELLREDAQLDEAGRTTPPHAYVIPVQRDMTKSAELVRHPRAAGHRGRPAANAQFKIGDATYPAGSYVIKAASPTGASRRTCSRSRTTPIRRSAPTTTAAGRWATRSTWTCRRFATRRCSTWRRRS